MNTTLASANYTVKKFKGRHIASNQRQKEDSDYGDKMMNARSVLYIHDS